MQKEKPFKLNFSFFQEVEHLDDLHTEAIEQSHDNGLQRTDFVEVRKNWMLIRR